MAICAAMPFRFLATAALLLAFAFAAGGANDRGKAEHVVVVVWDGMRPDAVTEKNAPTLFALAQSGVFFKRHRAAYPSSTNVNGAVLATGVSPGKNGIIANQEFRSEIDPRRAFDTADFPALDGSDPRVAGQHLKVPTIPEILQAAGHWTAVAGSKPVAQFFDRARNRISAAAKKSTVIYRGKILPTDAAERITSALGPFPQRKNSPNESEDDWTTGALTKVLWRDEIPKFSVLWLSEPDLTIHETAPGAPAALAATRRSDRNLARLLSALEAKDALSKTDIFVVSDHGFSTVDPAVDVAAQLRAAGLDAVRAFDENPRRGQVLVISLGGSVMFYVVERDPEVTSKLLDALQRADFAGVILTRGKREGTFSFAQAQIDASEGPDVIVACRWNDRPNEFGIAGQMTSDLGRSAGHGSHSTMSRHDMHNILIASGPDFRRDWESETPSGNIDLAPTILWLLGMKPPHPMQGRVLREAMTDSTQLPAASEKNSVAEREIGDRIWRQYLRAATVDGVTYILEGNGSATPLSKANPPASAAKPLDKAPRIPAPPDRR